MFRNVRRTSRSNFEHFRTSQFVPKPNFEPLEHHQKPNCSRTLLIKNGPNFFQNLQNRTSNMSEHLILAKNRTSNLPNITKNRTVREHRTVRSTSNKYLYSIPLLNKKPTKEVVNCHPFCSNTFPLLYSFPKMLKHLPTRIRLVSPSPPQIY